MLQVLTDAAAPASLGRLLQWLWTAACASRFAKARAWSAGQIAVQKGVRLAAMGQA
ncbi:hypothetical protein ACJJWD_06275 [Comamonas testosteroni]|uniref:hypothetical protein n=1 Tax=Comamonas testosteroni TaxID=285 RepID=UPI00389AC23C